ncbi:acetoacetate decarboxylase family protein [Paraburkholderia sp. DHOC27]|uniref:acetoacetate decarboxylase family protein n=1 Tax=Paraburkholderia sp. DHOC27 TaxID=2303330 RepID=UPI000E3D8CA1|nr:acetoacetate decarboxylase family protein [Paraburkholderia sp. DHOC27]RFU48568.1 acetoacetate decarboxylase [Paraburkholderia sp. DHOC27]
MLKGYVVPRTPLGQASLNPPPPWHYSGDVIGVEFWASPEATAATLPEGLTPDPQANGHAVALFIDWQFNGEHDEYLDPARYQYREFLLLVDARHGETPVAWCPYIFVDNDAALARGWIQGFPKRLGSVYQTRTYVAPSAAAAPVTAGGRFGASMSSNGQRLVDARVTLREPVKDPATLVSRPTVNLRYFPRLSVGQHDQPAVNELVLSVTDDLKLVDAWVGEGALSFPEAVGEELSALQPVRMGAGFRLGMSYSVTDLKLLDDLTHKASA